MVEVAKTLFRQYSFIGYWSFYFTRKYSFFYNLVFFVFRRTRVWSITIRISNLAISAMNHDF